MELSRVSKFFFFRKRPLNLNLVNIIIVESFLERVGIMESRKGRAKVLVYSSSFGKLARTFGNYFFNLLPKKA